MGVTKGLAGKKFSGSPKMLGVKRTININEKSKMTNPTMSLKE
jgi:hypothetical protein